MWVMRVSRDSLLINQHHTVDVLDDDDVLWLRECYKEMYKSLEFDNDLIRKCKKFKQVHIGNEKYSSVTYGNGTRHGRVMASWCSQEGTIDYDAAFRPCIINSFFSHRLGLVNGEETKYVTNVFADVKWPVSHSDPGHHNASMTVWDYERSVRAGPVNFLPIQRMYCKFAWAKQPSGRMYVSVIPTRVFI